MMLHKTICAFLLMGLAQGSAFAGTLATVNGKAITDEDLNHVVSNLSAGQRDAVLKDAGARQQLVQQLIDQELLAQEAAAKKIDDSKEFKEALAGFKKQQMVSLLIQRQLTGRVTEAAAKERFNKNKYKYSTDQVRAYHILLSTEKEANDVLAEVKKPGVDFQAVAEKKSKDPSVKNNRGDVGFFTRDMLDPAFTAAAFSTKVDEVTGPVKTLFGFHVIKVVERKNGKVPEFAEVEQKVRSDVQRDIMQDYLAQLRKKAKIKK